MGSSDHTCSIANMPSGSYSLLLLLIGTTEDFFLFFFFFFSKYKLIIEQTDVCSLNYKNLLGYHLTMQNGSLTELSWIMAKWESNRAKLDHVSPWYESDM